MDTQLHAIASQLAGAATPETVFGELPGEKAQQEAHLRAAYRRLARQTHPDRFPAAEDRRVAQEAFCRLTVLLQSAEEKVKNGRYGSVPVSAAVVVRSAKFTYSLDGSFSPGMVYNGYPAVFEKGGRTRRAFFKVVRDPADNDLAANEARVLAALATGKFSSKFGPYLPRRIDSFLWEQAGGEHRVNVFERGPGWYTLAQVRQAYPGGVDPKDMAWMFRRLLVALGFLHQNGVIHGAVLPANISILPETHGLVLEEYSFAVQAEDGRPDPVAVIDPAFEAWYPAEVMRKESPGPATDLCMAARCMMYLLGANPPCGPWPAQVPGFLRSFLKGCTLPGFRSRPGDAWALKEEFDELLQRHWGPRKFHPFSMKGL